MRAKGWTARDQSQLTLSVPPPCYPSNTTINAYGCTRQGLTIFTKIMTKRDRVSTVQTRLQPTTMAAPLASAHP